MNTKSKLFKVLFFVSVSFFILSLLALFTPLRYEVLAATNLSTTDGSYLLYFYLPIVLFASFCTATAILAYASNKIQVLAYVSLAAGTGVFTLLALQLAMHAVQGLQLIDYFGLTSWLIYVFAPFSLPFGIVAFLIGTVSKSEPRTKRMAVFASLMCILASLTALMTIVPPIYKQFVLDQNSARREVEVSRIDGKYAYYQDMLQKVTSCSIDYVETQKSREYPDFKYLYIRLKDGETFFNQREQEIYYSITIKPTSYIYLPISDKNRLHEAINASSCGNVEWRD